MGPIHPGIVKTNIARQHNGIQEKAYKILKNTIAISPEKAALNIVYMAVSKKISSVSGECFVRGKIRKTSKQSYDEILAEKLWKISLNLTNFTNFLSS